ncbi:hypothetical protein CRENBAI_014160 [Crenichthys baileyi]|uniref:Uncharacterized protein n=1 Tax=Crenichthys baileyi TaxID=28760 RepID=A0AAV9QXP2_9TELE
MQLTMQQHHRYKTGFSGTREPCCSCLTGSAPCPPAHKRSRTSVENKHVCPGTMSKDFTATAEPRASGEHAGETVNPSIGANRTVPLFRHTAADAQGKGTKQKLVQLKKKQRRGKKLGQLISEVYEVRRERDVPASPCD